LLFILPLSIAVESANARYTPVTVRTNLTLSSGIWNGDCYKKSGLLVNGGSPGPPIIATEGDIVIVRVTNGHTKGITIHFHGVAQRGTPFADGVPGISQLSILPGEIYEYRWRADNSGTYFYHAHTRFDASSVHGALIIHDPKEYLRYDDDRILLLNDYWHKNDEKLYDSILNKPVVWVGQPQAILLNGRAQESHGSSYSSIASSVSFPTTGCGYSTIPVAQGNTYRLRVINAGALSYISLKIDGHSMALVEADGYRTTPISVNHLQIGPGQRYSVLLKADQEISSYWIRLSAIWDNSDAKIGGAGLLTYDGAMDITTAPPPIDTSASLHHPDWILPQVHADSGGPIMPTKADDVLTLTLSPLIRGNSTEKHMVNNVSYIDRGSLMGTSLLDMAYREIDASRSANALLKPIPSLSIYPKGTVLDVIIQLDAKSCLDTHPWHLHGHSFWDIGQGPGLYTETAGAKAMPFSPVHRDTSIVYSQKDLDGANGCGWRRIRVKLDNPGIWPLHCHVHAHMVMGMMWLVGVGLDDLPPRAPLP
ncbi:Cupredoxin, partial [Piptocephalis cylindrospora]